MKLQPSESFNDIVLRTQQMKLVLVWPGSTQQMKLVLVWPGSKRSICLNWHIN
jgi:hypothetical protein